MEEPFKRCWVTRGSRVFLELAQFILAPAPSLVRTLGVGLGVTQK